MEDKTKELDELVQKLDANIEELFRDLPKLTDIDTDENRWYSLVNYYEKSYRLQFEYLFATAGLKYGDPMKDEELAFRRVSMLRKAVQTALEYTRMKSIHDKMPGLIE
nr:hypothetical protein [Nanoarchaeum sp.]